MVNEDPFEFERRGVELARALHDPAGTQGALMVQGSERDGVFVNHDDINVYEFTTRRDKEKAQKDAEKLAGLLEYLLRDKANQFKPATAWFVTRDEPTGDQRTVVAQVAKRAGRTIHAISIAQMYKRICNSELYLQARDKAPFGSTAFTPEVTGRQIRVAVKMLSREGGSSRVQELGTRLCEGGRVLIVGDYGAGKSHALRDLYQLLRREHFRRAHLTPFPIHINLRDCAGLKTPAEIFRRHAEEVGFDHANGLMSAWRAGMCVLLLDGFDEVLPSRWLGSVADLKNVRWDALSPIRRLIEETPQGAGIVVAGRSHYFSNEVEMTAALGLRSLDILQIPDFDEDQLKDFLRQSEATWKLPDWVPARPLLLGYLVSLGGDSSSVITAAGSKASGWRTFLSAICAREARMFSAVRPATIEKIMARVATLARGGASATGPISTDQLRAAFVSVNGFQPDEEGLQLLLRLPGLTNSLGLGEGEMRSFADEDLAETAYGLDLADFVIYPYDETHPLAGPASWVNASSGLAASVAAETLLQSSFAEGQVRAALTKRQNEGRYDAVLADLIATVTDMPTDRDPARKQYLVSGVAFEELQVVDHPVVASTTYQDCLIERLDLTAVDEESDLPNFPGCVITFVDGVSGVTPWLRDALSSAEIDGFSTAAQTTAGIMQLKLDRESKVALTILKKIFSQRGSGRKESALSRGLALADREIVSSVLAELVSQEWIRREVVGNTVVYVGNKDRRRDALQCLDAPNDFRLK
ncbi:NACHT domain-containing protein [Propionicimonas sp.]|uniref:NACHT domain-containing protein n=1 Tax=Propionicimonas sp. TaxID=1955623 RepID=UPI0039E4921D